jgi:thiamine-phosphate pyrophosphorylase
VKRLGDRPYICLITQGRANPSNFEIEKKAILDTVREAIEDGVDLVQIREKALTAKLLFELVSEAVAISRTTSSLVLVNDRADIAVTAGADGVHLPETSFPPNIIRSAFGTELVIGVSTHSLKSAETSARSGADFVFFGPVFDTPGKGTALGTDSLRDICAALDPFPVIALGGVDKDNLERALATGSAGVAAIRSLNERESRMSILRRVERFCNGGKLR